MDNKKRRVGSFIGICLLCTLLTTPVKADEKIGNTVGGNGTYSVEGSYTVTIPEKITLQPGSVDSNGNSVEAHIKVGKGTNIPVDRQLAVYVKPAESIKGGQLLLDRYDAAGSVKQTGTEADTCAVAFDWYNKEKKLKDGVTLGDGQEPTADQLEEIGYTPVSENTAIATYSNLAAADVEIGKIRLAAKKNQNLLAGHYKGSITFELKIESK